MNKFVNYLFLLLSVFLISSTAFSENVKVASLNGSKKHACLIKDPSNLLVSLKKKKFGLILDFDAEINKTTKTVKKTNTQIKALKGKTDSKSVSKKKKLKKSIKDLKLLLTSINNCRSKNNSQISVFSSVNCADTGTLEGTTYDDLNPCTAGDKCQGGKCSGNSVNPGETVNCSFASCAKAIEQCKDNKITICVEGAASDEICNAVDDDCNGETDEKGVCNQIPTPTATVAVNSTGAPTAVPTLNVTGIPTTGLTPGVNNTSTSTPTKTNTPTLTFTNTPTRTATNTPTKTATNTPTKTATATNTPILLCPIAENNINLGAPGCGCGSNNDCLGVCSASSCLATGTGCPSSGNLVAVSAPNCPCTTNIDCTSGICRANTDGLCGPPTSLSIGCAKTDNNLRVNFPGCACTDNADCLSPMTCTTVPGSTAKYCSGGGVTCFDTDNTQGLSPKNCPCDTAAACQSGSCAAAQGVFGSACR